MKLYKSLEDATKETQNVLALKVSVKSDEFLDQLLQFENLEELYLDGICRNFPRNIPGWKKLKILSIKWPAFSGDLSGLFTLPALENLKIIETPLKTFLLPLGHAAAPLKSLTVKDCGLESLPEELSMLQKITDMNLSGNALKKLPASFESLKLLKRLNLDGNQFQEFPTAIKKMTALSHLSIDGNLFSDEEKARIQREHNIWVA